MTLKKRDIRDTIPRHPKRKWRTRDSADYIIVHTTASDTQDPNRTAKYHITPGKKNHISRKGCPSICYHDFITKDGIVYHCNDYTDITWHAGWYNKRSVGVVLAFKGQDGISPSPQQMEALEKHLVILCLYLKVLPVNVIGHREVPGMWKILGNGSKVYKKVCPGMGVDLDQLRRNVTGRLQRRLAAEGLYYGKIDHVFGLKSKAALRAFNPLGNRLSKVNWKGYRV